MALKSNKYYFSFFNEIIFLTLLLLIINCSLLIGEIRYVSKTGSSTPPYTSWETASDSIQKAINISNFGDTIYVANGVYKERVVMIPGLSLIGSGMDSCLIDTRSFDSSGYALHALGDNFVTGFLIIVSHNRNNYGILCQGDSIKIIGNKIINALIGIWLNYSISVLNNNILQNMTRAIFVYNTNAIISNCEIRNSQSGIVFETNIFDRVLIIKDNFFQITQTGINHGFNRKPKVYVWNNEFYLNGNIASAFAGGNTDSVFFYNNLIIAQMSNVGMSNSILPTYAYNNVFIGNFSHYGISSSNYNVVKNNIVKKGYIGIYAGPGHNPIVKYNNSWKNERNYSGFTADSTNLSVDPMFENEDSLNFYLQMYSLLIDAGDPEILDVDGSRSDIGLYGGPFGQRYNYLDLPPRPPVNISAFVDSQTVTIKWNKNTESDFGNYKLFRDTVSGFKIDSTKLVTEIKDSFYTHKIKDGVSGYYYKLTAVDNQDNESNPSEEISVILTSINEYPLIVNDYKLYQNYPNPFNPSTKISYRLKESGYVKLYVYDIKGELLTYLVNEYKESGYYEIQFTPESADKNLASGIYLYRIEVKNEEYKFIFSDSKKMIYIK